MAIQMMTPKAKMIFTALNEQPTVQAPKGTAKVVSQVYAGFLYECILTCKIEKVQWAALRTSAKGLSAEWVKVTDESTSEVMGVLTDLN